MPQAQEKSSEPSLTRPTALHAAVIGGGFCGLAAAYELTLRGVSVTLFERDAEVGGLAGSFPAGGTRLEKFYHHWFTNDVHVMELIAELEKTDLVMTRPTATGTYLAHNFYKLSTPMDLLRFSPLPFFDRIRLGLLALRARRIRNWRALEDRTAAEWLRALGGDRVYEVVWEPLLTGKFGELAEEVGATWFWSKLKLRGGSRGKGGEERLAYYQGGFAALADALADAIRAHGGEIRTNATVQELEVEEGQVKAIVSDGKIEPVDAVIATPALPIVADLVAPHVDEEYAERLLRIRYLANLCVVLELDRSLSDLYWLNVNDPGFPFVGVIEHTNFEPSDTYGGRHIVYLSKYLPETDQLFRMADDEVIAFAIENLRKMFPDLRDDIVLGAHVWRARYAQPVVERNYSRLIPDTRTPLANLYLATMAQIYPQDRGTNYAIWQGREVAKICAETLMAGKV